MRVNIIDRHDWLELLVRAEEFMARIQGNEVFIVRGFMDTAQVDAFKSFCLKFSADTEATWQPCLDGCPDYHRIHHNYPNAYVPSIQHAYYFHPWNERFASLNAFTGFKEIFELKRATGGLSNNDFLTNLPSEGPIARLVSHQYPRGGGGQAEHIDPVSPFAKVQTIIQAASPGIDYRSGGFYVNDPHFGVINIDALTRKGDLILVSPGVRHGVAPIDPEEPLDWSNTDGRWIIMPIIINSDHVKDPALKPMKVGAM